MSNFLQTLVLLFLSFVSIVSARGTPVRGDVTHVNGKRAICTPSSAANAGTDDVPAIESAIASCGNGGTIVIPAGKTYAIRSTLSFAGCTNCDFQIEGTLKASDDLTYWEGKKAIFLVSDITTAKIRSVTGTGLVDGNGQAAWDYFATNTSYARPTLMYITGSSGISVSNLKFQNAPNVFHSAAGDSKNIAYSDITLTATSSSSNAAKNTDGWDIGPASYVTITNVAVTNDDDCVAFKPGADYVSVSGITCTGSHGLSVGSLGKSGSDVVSNVYVYNATMVSSTKAVGIKLYPGGYGTATVSNVTWDTVTVTGCDYAAQIQSCYGEDATYCASNPGSGSITDVYFKNFKGTTSTKYEPVIANLDCPADGTCDVYLSGWSVKPPSGTAEYLCASIDSTPGVTCTSGASG
ncbi:probable polygalacturonase 1 precursor [Phialocephala subalpina]|uniref:Probable polygalacturonase 1 n=1 Tax=Phialocephala subalpina TaxID=576137 RepID=A0A1L7XNU2_9HELO|nr:probable polygalacturonase 1 precursor [Phialocephala subalpina]